MGWEARCSSMVRAFAHDMMGRRIDPSWGGPIELFQNGTLFFNIHFCSKQTRL